MKKELKYEIIKEYPKGESRHYDVNNPIAVKGKDIENNTVKYSKQHTIYDEYD